MKLSKHPVGTIINIHLRGRYELVKVGETKIWRNLTGPANHLTKKFVNKIQKNTPNQIKILAAPWSVVVELQQMLVDEYGHHDDEGKPITFDSVYKDAIERDEESKERQRIQNSAMYGYAAKDAELTQAMFESLRKPLPIIYKHQKVEEVPTTERPLVSMFAEEWHKIPGYNWSVSNQGRVRNDNISKHITRPYQHNGNMYVELTDDQGRYVETSMAWIFRHSIPEKSKKS